MVHMPTTRPWTADEARAYMETVPDDDVHFVADSCSLYYTITKVLDDGVMYRYADDPFDVPGFLLYSHLWQKYHLFGGDDWPANTENIDPIKECKW